MAELARIRRRRAGAGTLVPFCSSCGELFDGGEGRRVCPSCGLGVLLSCPGDALPARPGAFLVVDRQMQVTAASTAAERLLGRDPAGRSMATLLSGRDGNGELSRQVARAASGLSGTASVPVSLPGRRGSFEARIAPCGPPRAALVLLHRADD